MLFQARAWVRLALALAMAFPSLLPPATCTLDCQALMDHYLEKHHKEAIPYTGDNIVYFLHVPRTAGRTFHSCLLKMGVPPYRRCPKAYDHLRLNMTVPNCYLLSSHDDFSVVSMLKEDVSVVSQLRDPIDRVLSAYEFAVEVASRLVNRPPNFKKRGNKIATEDVWPWSYMVPFFAEDIKTRRKQLKAQPLPEEGNWVFVRAPDGDEFYYNRVRNLSKWNLTAEELPRLLPPLDPYDNPLYMPLAEWAQHPVTTELLNNGGAFQVLGITNYSHWGDAAAMRQCAWDNPATHDKLVEVAKNRIRRFVHVGTTDRLDDSVASAATALLYDLDGPAYGGGDDDAGKGGPQRTAAMDAATSNYTAADLPALAKQVRQSRYKLQEAQKALYKMAKDGLSDSEASDVIKAQINQARVELRDAQDALIVARTALPTGGAGAAGADGQGSAAGGADADTSYGTKDDLDADPSKAKSADLKRLANPLGTEYVRCAQRAQQRSAQRRDSSLSTLVMPDGRSIAFSKAARKKIPPEVIDLIRQRNTLDTAIHRLALELLDEHRRQQAELGKLKTLPPAQPLAQLPARQAAKNFRIPKPKHEEHEGDEL